MASKSNLNISSILPQITAALEVIKEAYLFFKNKRLWRGIFENKWILVVTILISFLFSYNLIFDCIDYFSSDSAPTSINIDIEDLDNIDPEVSSKIKSAGRKALLSGGTKYLFFIMLEVIIFFFATKTLGILKHKTIKPTFRQFVNAEKRMIKVMVRSFIKSILVNILLYIVLSIIGLSSISGFAMFFVHAYYIGMAFLDNYNEQYDKTIKESFFIASEHRYAATTLGVVISGLLFVPLIGPIITPFLGAISATIYGHKFEIEDIEMID